MGPGVAELEKTHRQKGNSQLRSGEGFGSFFSEKEISVPRKNFLSMTRKSAFRLLMALPGL